MASAREVPEPGSLRLTGFPKIHFDFPHDPAYWSQSRAAMTLGDSLSHRHPASGLNSRVALTSCRLYRKSGIHTCSPLMPGDAGMSIRQGRRNTRRIPKRRRGAASETWLHRDLARGNQPGGARGHHGGGETADAAKGTGRVTIRISYCYCTDYRVRTGQTGDGASLVFWSPRFCCPVCHMPKQAVRTTSRWTLPCHAVDGYGGLGGTRQRQHSASADLGMPAAASVSLGGIPWLVRKSLDTSLPSNPRTGEKGDCMFGVSPGKRTSKLLHRRAVTRQTLQPCGMGDVQKRRSWPRVCLA